jgi:hypothetical protein
MKTGDKVKFKDYGEYNNNYVSNHYSYTSSERYAKLLNIKLAVKQNEGTTDLINNNYAIY